MWSIWRRRRHSAVSKLAGHYSIAASMLWLAPGIILSNNFSDSGIILPYCIVLITITLSAFQQYSSAMPYRGVYSPPLSSHCGYQHSLPYSCSYISPPAPPRPAVSWWLQHLSLHFLRLLLLQLSHAIIPNRPPDITGYRFRVPTLHSHWLASHAIQKLFRSR